MFVERSFVQHHLVEVRHIACRAVQPAFRGRIFRSTAKQVHVLALQLTVIVGVYGCDALLLARAEEIESYPVHAQRTEDAFGNELLVRIATRDLDDAAKRRDPHITVKPFCARLENQGLCDASAPVSRSVRFQRNSGAFKSPGNPECVSEGREC